MTNEDHEQIIPHCLTVIVKNEEPVSSDGLDDDGGYDDGSYDDGSGNYGDNADNSDVTASSEDQTNNAEEGNIYE